MAWNIACQFVSPLNSYFYFELNFFLPFRSQHRNRKVLIQCGKAVHILRHWKALDVISKAFSIFDISILSTDSIDSDRKDLLPKTPIIGKHRKTMNDSFIEQIPVNQNQLYICWLANTNLSAPHTLAQTNIPMVKRMPNVGWARDDAIPWHHCTYHPSKCYPDP